MNLRSPDDDSGGLDGLTDALQISCFLMLSREKRTEALEHILNEEDETDE